jgi:IS30 family transposase
MSFHTQVTQGQCYQVEALYEGGHNQVRIANVLKVHKSKISLELRRN